MLKWICLYLKNNVKQSTLPGPTSGIIIPQTWILVMHYMRSGLPTHTTNTTNTYSAVIFDLLLLGTRVRACAYMYVMYA